MKFANALILFYYIIHIPITLFIDSQVIFPAHLYPLPLTNVLNNYVKTLEDNLVGTKPMWFVAMTYGEIFFQFPFFFISIYAFWKKRNWIRIPTIIYGTHVATTLVPIIGSVLFDEALKPQNQFALLALLAIYSIWFIVPVWMVYYAWVNEDLFKFGSTKKQNQKSK